MFPMLALLWNLFFLNYLRPMYKWVLRKVTGKCELLRITSGQSRGADRAEMIGEVLLYSVSLCNIPTFHMVGFLFDCSRFSMVVMFAFKT